jgi:hypothetical protein
MAGLPFAPTARVPLLETDVHDLEGVAEVSRHLFAADRRGSPG